MARLSPVAVSSLGLLSPLTAVLVGWALLDQSMRDILVASIDDLPEREKTVMGLYYEEDLNLREIGEVLGVSESRVCQLHSQAIARLRSRIHGTKSGPKPRRGRPPKNAGNPA